MLAANLLCQRAVVAAERSEQAPVFRCDLLRPVVAVAPGNAHRREKRIMAPHQGQCFMVGSNRLDRVVQFGVELDQPGGICIIYQRGRQA